MDPPSLRTALQIGWPLRALEGILGCAVFGLLLWAALQISPLVASLLVVGGLSRARRGLLTLRWASRQQLGRGQRWQLVALLVIPGLCWCSAGALTLHQPHSALATLFVLVFLVGPVAEGLLLRGSGSSH